MIVPRFTGALAFALTLTVVTVSLVVETLELGPIARAVPLAAGSLTLILLLVQLTIEARRWMSARSGETATVGRFGHAAIRRITGHVLGLLIAVLLLGIVAGIPLYTFAAHARAASATIGLLTASVLAAGCVTADRVLGGLYPGILWSLIG